MTASLRPFVGGLSIAAACFICVVVVSSSYPQEKNLFEYSKKAAYLYYLASFADWPSNSIGDSIIVTVLGKDPFGPALEKNLDGKSVNGRKFEIRRVESLTELEPCQILFVSESEKENLEPVFDKIRDWSVLTVSEFDGFIESGGIFSFFYEDDSLRFIINVNESERVGLKIHSRVLNLAVIYRENS